LFGIPPLKAQNHYTFQKFWEGMAPRFSLATIMGRTPQWDPWSHAEKRLLPKLEVNEGT